MSGGAGVDNIFQGDPRGQGPTVAESSTKLLIQLLLNLEFLENHRPFTSDEHFTRGG
jgi:hypothetical protein